MRTTPSADPTLDGLGEVPSSRLMAACYDPFLWWAERLGMARRRSELLAAARGRVLEIGAGTGLNLPHYPDGLVELVLTEPGRAMARPLARQLDRWPSRATIPVSRVPARAERLPFDDDSFDTVVATLVLCTVADPEAAVDETARVLKPGGRLLFCEHVSADAGWRRDLQRRAAGAWEAFADGCRCDRPTLPLIESRFPFTDARTANWRGMPAIVRPLVWGMAAA